MCSGIGGFTAACNNLGLTSTLAIDFNRLANLSYQSNFTHCARELDIMTCDAVHAVVRAGPSIITAGTPCQPFSRGGDNRGFADSRADPMLRVLQLYFWSGAACLVLESVAGITLHADVHYTLEKFTSVIKGHCTEAAADLAALAPMHRARWFAVITSFGYPKAVLSAWPNKGPTPLMPTDNIFLDCSADDLQELMLDRHELAVFTDETYGQVDRRPLYVHRTIPTLLHSYGNLTRPCPCRCRNTAMAPRRLRERGAWGTFLYQLDEKGQQQIRWMHPRPLATLLGFPPSFKLPASLRLALAQLGNCVSVPQAQWALLSVVNMFASLDQPGPPQGLDSNPDNGGKTSGSGDGVPRSMHAAAEHTSVSSGSNANVTTSASNDTTGAQKTSEHKHAPVEITDEIRRRIAANRDRAIAIRTKRLLEQANNHSTSPNDEAVIRRMCRCRLSTWTTRDIATQVNQQDLSGGEAGTATFLHQNVTGIYSKWKQLLKDKSDVLFLSETHHSNDIQAMLTKYWERRRDGISALWTPPVTGADGRPRRGCIIIARNGWRIEPIAPSVEDTAGRILVGRLWDPTGTQQIVAGCIYGDNTARDPLRRLNKNNERTVKSLLDWCKHHSEGARIVLAGDWHQQVESSPTLHGATSSGTFFDPEVTLLAQDGNWTTQAGPATSRPGTGVDIPDDARRIDYFLFSKACRPILLRAYTTDLGYPGHLANRCIIQQTKCKSQYKPPPKDMAEWLNRPDTIKTESQLADSDFHDTYKLMDEGNADGALSSLYRTIELDMERRCRKAYGGKLPKAFLGRGQQGSTSEAPQRREPDDGLQHRWAKRILHSLDAYINQPNQSVQRKHQTWSNIARTIHLLPAAISRPLHHILDHGEQGIDTAKRLQATLQAWLNTTLQDQANARTALRQKRDTSLRDAVRFVRQTDRPHRAMLVQLPTGAVTADLQQIAEEAHRAWQEIYEQAGPDQRKATAALHRLGWPTERQAEPTRFLWEPITTEILQQSLGKMKATGAPGLDGWHVGELKCWPPAAWKVFADMMNRIEGQQLQWPNQLLEMRVVLLTKPMGPKPQDSDH